jgi:hypothetical protein
LDVNFQKKKNVHDLAVAPNDENGGARVGAGFKPALIVIVGISIP